MEVFHGEDGETGYLVDVGVDGGSTSFVVAVSFCYMVKGGGKYEPLKC